MYNGGENLKLFLEKLNKNFKGSYTDKDIWKEFLSITYDIKKNQSFPPLVKKELSPFFESFLRNHEMACDSDICLIIVYLITTIYRDYSSEDLEPAAIIAIDCYIKELGLKEENIDASSLQQAQRNKFKLSILVADSHLYRIYSKLDKIKKKQILTNVINLINQIKKDDDFIPEENLLRQFMVYLRDSNLKPEKGEGDIPLKIIDLIYSFKVKYAKLPKELEESIDNYFAKINKLADDTTQNYRHYTATQLEDSIIFFKRNPRSEQNKSTFKRHMIQRMLFLNYEATLSPKNLKISDLETFFKLFKDVSGLNNKKAEYQKLKTKQYDSSNTEADLIKERIDDKERKIQLQKDIQYLTTLCDIYNEISFEELIIFVAEIANEQPISASIFDFVSKLGLKINNKAVAIATIKILQYGDSTKLPGENELDICLKNVIPYVTNKEIDLILSLSKKFYFKINKAPRLLVYFDNLLITEQDEEIRNKVSNILTLYDKDKLLEEDSIVARHLSLEQLSRNQSKDLKERLHLYQNSVQDGVALTIGCFEDLSGLLIEKQAEASFNQQPRNFSRLAKIIATIVKTNLQQIPDLFIKRFEQYINKVVKQNNFIIIKEALLIIKTLITNDNINLENIVQSIINLDINTKEDFINDGLDIIFIALQSNKVSPELTMDIRSWLEKNTTINKYILNILKFIKKEASELDLQLGKLKNHKSDLKERIEALNFIVKEKEFYSIQYILDLLVYLIKHEKNSDLRSKALKSLIELLPDSYQGKQINFSLSELSIEIYDHDAIDIDNIVKLAYKDLKNQEISTVIDILIYDISPTEVDGQSLNLLESLLINIKNYNPESNILTDEQIENLFTKINYANRQELKIKLCAFMEKHFPKLMSSDMNFEFVQLKTINNLNININNLIETINDLIESNLDYVFSLETVDLLVKNLANQQFCQQNNEIAATLLKIDIRQGLDDDHFRSIFKEIIINENLIEDLNIIKIIIRAIYRGNITPEISNLLLQQFSLNMENIELHKTLTNAIVALANKKQKIADNVINDISNALENTKDISLKIKYIEILSETVKFNLTKDDSVIERIIEIAKKEALSEINKTLKEEYILIIKLKYNSLIILEQEVLSNKNKGKNLAEMEQFLINYYNTLKAELNFELSNTIETYINNQQFEDVRSKYYLLRTLTCELINNLGIDTKIFSEFHPNQWGKELICSELLKRLLLNTSDDVNDVVLLKFRNNISELEKSNKLLQEQEKVLQTVIDIQKSYNDVNFNIVNDILYILTELIKNNELDYQNILSIIYEKKPDFYLEIKSLWLKEKLILSKLRFSEEELSNLNQQLLSYDSQLVRISLEKLTQSKDLTTGKLINFFYELNFSDELSFDEKSQFMVQSITKNSTINLCLKNLFNKILEIRLEEIFVIYDYDFEFLEFFDTAVSIQIGKIYFLLDQGENEVNEVKYKIKISDDQIIEDSLAFTTNIQINPEFLNNNKVGILREILKADNIQIEKTFKIKDKEEISKESLSKLSIKLKSILDSGWSLDAIFKLVEAINNKKEFDIFCDAVEPIYEYEIKEFDVNVRGDSIFAILKKHCGLWKKEIHQLAIFNTFTGSHTKTLEELNKEIYQENAKSEAIILKDSKLITEYQKVIQYGQTKSKLAKYDIEVMANNQTGAEISNTELAPKSSKLITTSIAEWNKDDLRLWSERVRIKGDYIPQYEKIAIVKRAMELSSGFTVREIQLLSLLILLNPEKEKGRLTQINTGEGKTTIIAMLAAVKVLEGHTVDIITSSSELAKPQSEQQKKFFDILGITVSHNGADILDKKTSYKADVLYGAAEDFQGDILRDEYSKLGTRSERKCDVAIVDEVDSMLIDGGNHIVMLATPLPAMDYLEPLLAAIWIQIRETAKRIEEHDCKAYFIETEDGFDENGRIKSVKIETLIPIVGTKRNFIKNATEKHIRKLIRDESLLINEIKNVNYELHLGKPQILEEPNNIYLYKENGKINYILINQKGKVQNNLDFDVKTVILDDNFLKIHRNEILKAIAEKKDIEYDEWTDYIKLEKSGKLSNKFPEIKIPQHLRDLVIKVQLSKWIDSAIYAKYECDENKHYILLNEGRTVAPVDASNTGVVQHNMHWDNGLHQFLQIKHGAKVSAESLTTNFISNVSFFQRYKSNIYGLTGTLGSDKARELLEDFYKVDSVIIPPFRKKQYLELKEIIAEQENDWYSNIITTSMNKLSQGRGVLIITEYIKVAEKLAKILKEPPYSYDTKKIKLYTTSEGSHVTQEELKSGEIIISTNIAGRGTDIKPSLEIEQNGGLHVCLTFLPINARVEAQNFGRTSRTGNKGTSQLVLCSKETDNLELKLARNRQENKALEEANEQIKKVCAQDQVFIQFCTLLDEFNSLDRNDHIIKSIEERFAIWLKMQKLEEYDAELLLNNFEKFKEKILQDKKENLLIKNPCYHVLIGNKLLSNNDNQGAIKEFEKAVKLDPDFQINAYYNMGYARIAEYGNAASQDIYRKEMKLAQENLQKAKSIIEENFEPMLDLMSQASDSPVFLEQLQHKMIIYSIQKNTIEQAIGIGEDEFKKLEEARKEEAKKRIRNKSIKDKQNEEITDKEIQEELEESYKEEAKHKIRYLKINQKNLEINAKREEIQQRNRSKTPEQQTKELDDFINSIITEPTEQEIQEELKKVKKDIKKQDFKQKFGVLGEALNNNNGLTTELLGISTYLPEDQDLGLYQEEIDEFNNNGLRGTFAVNSIPPIPWGTILSLGALAISQAIAGGVLTVFTLGAASTIGMSLISEGVSDLIMVIKDGIINRNLDLASWAKQKAISLTVSILSAGWGAIKDVAKTAMAGIKAGIGVVNSIANQSVKEGWKLAAKAIGIRLANQLSKEISTQLMCYGVNQILMPKIERAVIMIVEKPIQQALLDNAMVEALLKIDGRARDNKYQNLIKKAALEILDSYKGSNELLTIIKGLAVGFISNKNLSTAVEFKRITDVLQELHKLTPRFIKELNERITIIYNQASADDNENANTTQQQSDNEHTQTIISNQHSKLTDITLKEEEINQAQLNRKPKTSSKLEETLSSNIAKSMCSIIQRKLISPLSEVFINYGIEQLTASSNKRLQGDIENYKAERRIHFMQSNDIDNRVPRTFKQFESEKAKEKAFAKADAIIKELKDGGEAGLTHLGVLSDETGRSIQVYNENGGLLYIIGEDKVGKPIKIEHHKNIDGSGGHWTLPGTFEPPEESTGKNNCLFDVIGFQIGRKGDELREAAIQRMSNKRELLAYQSADIIRLEAYNHDALMLGGGRYYTTRNYPGAGNTKKAYTVQHRDGRTEHMSASQLRSYSRKRAAEGRPIHFAESVASTSETEDRGAIDSPVTMETSALPSWVFREGEHTSQMGEETVAVAQKLDKQVKAIFLTRGGSNKVNTPKGQKIKKALIGEVVRQDRKHPDAQLKQVAKAVDFDPPPTGQEGGIQVDLRDYGKDPRGNPKRNFGYYSNDKGKFNTPRGVCRARGKGNAYTVGVGGQGPGVEVIGTFLHELEHAAARSVFQNSAIPYSEETNEIETEYLNPILKLAEKWGYFPEKATKDNPKRNFIFRKDSNKTVPEVFKNMSGYNKEQWIKEMIVRPGQARIDRDRNKEYFELLERDPDLRQLDNFWREKFIPRMKHVYDSDWSDVSSKALTYLRNVSHNFTKFF